MDILDLLASDNYIPFNRTLAKELGIEPAILFGALCGYQRHYKMQEFFREQANIMEDTCLSEYAVRQATKILQDKELIIVNKKGLPAKNYYQINTTRLIEYLSTSGCEIDTTGNNENDTTINTNNITNNNINDKIDNKIDNKINKKETKHKYGEYKNVLLTNTEYNKLIADFGESNAKTKIDNMDKAIEMKGYKYKSHYLAILNWNKRDKQKAPQQQSEYISGMTMPRANETEEEMEFKERILSGRNRF